MYLLVKRCSNGACCACSVRYRVHVGLDQAVLVYAVHTQGSSEAH